MAFFSHNRRIATIARWRTRLVYGGDMRSLVVDAFIRFMDHAAVGPEEAIAWFVGCLGDDGGVGLDRSSSIAFALFGCTAFRAQER